MSAENCDHRLSKEQTWPVTITGKGKYSDKACNLLLHDRGEMLAPRCKAPQENTEDCPVAKYYRGEIDNHQAHKELDKIHDENFVEEHSV